MNSPISTNAVIGEIAPLSIILRPSLNNIARLDITLPFIDAALTLTKAFNIAPKNDLVPPKPNVNSILRCYINSIMIPDANCYFTKTSGATNPTFVIHIFYPSLFPNDAVTNVLITTEFAEKYNGILLPTVAGSIIFFYYNLMLNIYKN